MSGRTRLDPVVPPFTESEAAVLHRMMPPSSGVEPLALFRLFARNLPMAGAMADWGAYELSRVLTLSRRQREIVILRVCARCRCEYEWGVHVSFFAERSALSAAQVAATVLGDHRSTVWSVEDALLVSAVDQLHDEGTVDDGLWAELAERFRPEQLLDLTMLAGWYHAIAYTANATGIECEPWAARFPATAAAS